MPPLGLLTAIVEVSDSEAPSLAAAHHWTARPQLWPRSPLSARTHRSWSRPVTTVSPGVTVPGPVCAGTCGAAPAQASPASTNMKSKFDSGSGGRGQAGEPAVQGRVSPGCSYSGTQAAGASSQGTPSSDIITSSQTHTHEQPDADLLPTLRGEDTTYKTLTTFSLIYDVSPL